MKKALLTLLLSVVSLSFPSTQKYCIQVATYRSIDLAMTDFEKIKDFPEARIELRGNVYLLRVGAEERSRDLILMLRKVRRFFPDAFIKKCEIDPSYVIYPEPEKMEKPKEEEKPKAPEPDIKKDIEELKRRIETLRKDIASLKTEEKGPYEFEKFLFSVGLFTGGLFLFTWFLIILLYRKVGSVSEKEARLVNDLFNLIKVLNLLGRGYTVKMERGKIMVYDKEKDRWKEVE